MKIVETKIYLRFISWFIVVSLLPIAALFVVTYIYNPKLINTILPFLTQTILIGLLVSLALVLLLSWLATRYLSGVITGPIQLVLQDLSKVVEALFKSVQDISQISQNNSELAEFLLTSSRGQQKGLNSGTKAVSEMLKSLNAIMRKTKTAAKNSQDIDDLAAESGGKTNKALDSLVAVKHLLTENQKLSQALDQYANQVKAVASRVEILADTAKFLSLNVSIRASKESFGEEFSGLVAQIRELNTTSKQAADSIQTLASDMQRQIKTAKESSIYEWEETGKTINIIGQTIKFLNKIVGKVANISQGIRVINQETEDTHQEADSINSMIVELSKDGKKLVKHTDDITGIINQELVIIRALNRSSESLHKVTDTLNNLVGKV